MALTKYHAKRDLRRSPEPAGGQASAGPLHFVVQKHAASRLHYDFRLELDGVLKSWAVPKGPSMNPADKRLAIMVEDHPLDYRTFEGVIPPGNYGAGTVMVWDEGTYTDYECSDDPEQVRKHLKAGLKKGDLKFVLCGNKLKGAFVLVKLKTGDNDWLLIKKQDQYATTADVTQDDRSVLSGRTMAEIARPGLTGSGSGGGAASRAARPREAHAGYAHPGAIRRPRLAV
jgi:bifunctional non-homologous end joining protein LigD